MSLRLKFNVTPMSSKLPQLILISRCLWIICSRIPFAPKAVPCFVSIHYLWER